MLRILFRLAVLLFVLALAVALSDGGSGRAAAPQAGASLEGTIAYRYDYGNVEDEGEAIYALDASGRTELWSRHYGDQPGYTGNIDWSRGGELAFRIDEDIFAVGEGGGLPRQVIAGAEDSTYSDPSWSPSGDRLAVTHTGSIHVISSTNGTPMPGPIAQGSEPDWSPDGQKIVYRTGLALWITDPQGASASPLIEGLPQTPVRPSWSPNGQRIAFGGDGDSDLFVVGADGQGLVRITQTPNVEERDPEWSPDGTEIAYIRRAFGGPSQIYIVNVETGATRLVHDPGGVGRAHAISWLAPSLIHSLEITQGIQVAQSPAALEASLAGPAALPQAVGGGGRIAYLGVGGTGKIYSMEADGSDIREITPGREASWSPNGKQLAITDWGAGGADIYDLFRVDADGTNRVPLVVGPGADSSPSWSPDGTKIIFIRQTAPSGIYTADSSNGGNQQLIVSTSVHPNITAPNYSPDGQYIVYGENFSTIWRVNSDGANPVKLLEVSGAGADRVAQPAWSPDGSKIAFLRATASGSRQALWVMDSSGANPHEVANGPEDFVYWPTWSADSSQIAFQGRVAEPAACECAVPQGNDSKIFIVNADGSGLHPVGPLNAYHPAWQRTTAVIHSMEVTQGTQVAQSPSALKASLQANGQPPVPIVAGKSAALRIYVRQLQASEAGTYLFELSGHVNQVATRALTASCSPLERRAHQNNCSSVDFFFTPPVGAWNITLKVKNSGGGELENHTFNIQSVDSPQFTIKYVPICVALSSGALPTCPTAAIGTGADLLKKLFPVADNELNYGFLPVPQLDYSSPVDMYVLRAKLRQDYEMMSQGGFVADQLAAWIPAGGAQGGILGLSDPLWLGGGRKGHVSLQTDTSAVDPLDYQHTLAHEVGHNLGLRHTNLPDGCGASGAGDWPYPDSTIQEVGFDVTAQPPAVVPNVKFDVMTYCSPPGSNIWISPFDYTKLAHGAFQPQGNAAIPESAAAGQYLVVRGSAQADGSSASIDSAYVISSAQPAEPSHPMGNYCLHISGGAQLDYCFLLTFQDHRTLESLDSESFAVRVPLPPGTARVSLGEGFQELDVLELSGAVPSLQIEEPQQGAEWSGEETISWLASDTDGDPMQFAVMYSPDGGETWLPLAVDTTGNSFSFDTSVLDGNQVLIRVLASDGLNTTTVTTGPVSVSHGTERLWGDDNCDGSITLGDAIAMARFLVGLGVTQGDGCPAIGVTATVEGADRTWGDLDCSGAASLGDAISLARFLVGIVPNVAGCPAMGSTVRVQG